MIPILNKHLKEQVIFFNEAHRNNLTNIFFPEPIPKPRLNVSLSTSDEVKKKRPVPQPRSLASKSTSKLVSMTSEVHPVPSANVKIFKRYSSPLDPPLPSPPMTKNSSSSSSSDEDLPPALPARRPSAQSVKKGCPYYVSDVQKHDQNQ